jgi:hypothetical protein
VRGSIHTGGPRVALPARDGGSSPQGSAQGSSPFACGLKFGIYQGFQFGLLDGCKRGTRVPRRTPSRHQVPETLLLLRRKELIGLLRLDND